MTIWITGDTHIPIDISKLNSKKWPKGKELTREDYLIVAGDFGLVWEHTQPSREEINWTRWLQEKPWTTLFVDGNHECHPRLNALPSKQMFSSEVGVVADHIYHLRRGHIYTIPVIKNETKTFFVFGGADSIDKEYRIPFISWWPEEIPSREEFDRGWEALDKVNWEVDYVITHTAPESVILSKGFSLWKPHDPTATMLEQYWEKLTYKHWYFGHFHMDLVGAKETCLYQRIVQVIDKDVIMSGV